MILKKEKKTVTKDSEPSLASVADCHFLESVRLSNQITSIVGSNHYWPTRTVLSRTLLSVDNTRRAKAEDKNSISDQIKLAMMTVECLAFIQFSFGCISSGP